MFYIIRPVCIKTCRGCWEALCLSRPLRLCNQSKQRQVIRFRFKSAENQMLKLLIYSVKSVLVPHLKRPVSFPTSVFPHRLEYYFFCFFKFFSIQQKLHSKDVKKALYSTDPPCFCEVVGSWMCDLDVACNFWMS